MPWLHFTQFQSYYSSTASIIKVLLGEKKTSARVNMNVNVQHRGSVNISPECFFVIDLPVI